MSSSSRMLSSPSCVLSVGVVGQPRCHCHPCPGCIGCVLVLGAHRCWCMVVVVLVAVHQWWWWALIAVCVVGGPSLSFMSLHCLSIIAVRCLVATSLSVMWHLGIGGRGGCLLWRPWWLLSTSICLPHHCQIVSSGGVRWLFTHQGGQKQPDSDDVALQGCCCVVVCRGCCGQSTSVVGSGGHG